MSDLSNDVTNDSKRKQVSKRDYLNGTAIADRIEEATGARYTLLGAAGGNKDLDVDFSKDSKFKTMCAILGFHTKVGNVANTVLNDKEEPGTPDDAFAAIEEFIQKASNEANPVWAERTTGGVGARIDKAALAASIIAVMVAGGKMTQAESGAKYAAYLQRLEEDPQYVRQVRQVPSVATEYATRTGKAAKTLDDILV